MDLGVDAHDFRPWHYDEIADLIQKDLIDACDGIPLENFDRFTLQVHLNKLGVTRSKDRVLQIKAYMKEHLC